MSVNSNSFIHFFVLIFFLGIFGTACNTTQFLRDDELLITESSINFVDKKTISNKREARYELENIAKPRPNTGFFKFRLWVYLKLRDHKKEKGIKSFMKRKLGQAPSLYESAKVKKNKLQMKKYLKDNGYFESDIRVDTVAQNKKVKVKYFVETRGQYKIRDIYLPPDSSDIATIVYEANKKSLLKKGDPYQELLLSGERVRISEVANNKGYLNFDPNSIFYYVDTVQSNLMLDIHVRVDEKEKNKVHQVFQVGKTYLYPNFDLSRENSLDFKDSIIFQPDFIVIQDEKFLRPSTLHRLILQEEGDVYNKSYQDISISHLLDLGVFKFVNLRYKSTVDTSFINPSSSSDSLSVDSSEVNPVLDRLIYLTPGVEKSLTTDVELNNRTGSFYGIAAGINFNHKNVFDRALIWNNRLSGGVETQRGVGGSLINTIEVNFETSLSLPRLILFPRKIKSSAVFVPRTNLTLSNNYQQRANLYTINSTGFSFGYNWKPSRKVQHILNPLTIRRVSILSTSNDFETLLDENARLQESFTNLFIGGLEYTFIRSTQAKNPKDDYWYYRAKTKVIGNMFSLITGKGSNDQVGEILGQAYSQFISLEQDLRYYFPFLRKGKLAFRFVPAIGIAYGNSNVLPYVEQYFVGGSNSLRAFQIRGVGPGGFVNPNIDNTSIRQQFIDQTGDIKLEFNAEYRFPIFGFFKGALFADVGNVWLLNEDLESPGGDFNFTRFYKELAVGAGFGLRLDVDFFVLRLDLATPIRRPAQGQDFTWKLDNLNIVSEFDKWVWNIAIGYPF